MSALRILVPVKRVIDYAVSTSYPPNEADLRRLADWPTVLGEGARAR